MELMFSEKRLDPLKTRVYQSSLQQRPKPDQRPKNAAFFAVNSVHFSGRSSSAKIAETGQTGTQAPQSMHSTGSMYSISAPSNCGSSFLGWMQSTGHASTHAASLVPMQGSAITYAIEVKVSVSQ